MTEPDVTSTSPVPEVVPVDLTPPAEQASELEPETGPEPEVEDPADDTEPLVVEVMPLAGAGELAEPTTPVSYLLDLALGATVLAAARVDGLGRGASKAVRPVVHVVLRPPLLGRRYHPGRWLDEIARRGRTERPAARLQLERLLDTAVPALTTDILSRVDRTAVQRLVEQIIDDIDLAEIIRESTGSMASETVRSARIQAIAADQAVSRLVDRLFSRRAPRATAYESPDAEPPVRQEP